MLASLPVSPPKFTRMQVDEMLPDGFKLNRKIIGVVEDKQIAPVTSKEFVGDRRNSQIGSPTFRSGASSPVSFSKLDERISVHTPTPE